MTSSAQPAQRSPLARFFSRRFLRRALGVVRHALRFSLYERLRKLRVDPNVVLLLSKDGEDLADNILHLCRALNDPRYAGKKVWLGVHRPVRARAEALLREAGADRRVRVTPANGARFMRLLATAGFLITDSTLPPYFIKRPGQTILNTWHGTPLKHMGMDVPNRRYAMGNVQRNLLMSDYLIFPNALMERVMTTAYGLDHLYKGTILRGGYPRNEAFFDADGARRLRESLGWKPKQWTLYMPTFRGQLDSPKSRADAALLVEQLTRLDALLTDDQLFIVKTHLYAGGKIPYESFRHIVPFPQNCGAYALLNACDALVTDYSSVMFDFACARKPVLLFPYDKEDYERDRGLYLPIESLGLPLARTAEELAALLESPPAYDREAFAREYGAWDNAHASDDLLRYVLLGEKCLTERVNVADGRENVLLFASTLAMNGLTSSLLNLLSNLDLTRRNYFVTVEEERIKENRLRLSLLPDGVDIFPMTGAWYTVSELIAYALYFRRNRAGRFTRRRIERLYRREWARCFGMVDFDCAIQFAGYGGNLQRMFGYAPAPCRRVIFVHNDMEREIATRHNQHVDNLRWAYRTYDDLAVVSEGIIPPTRRLAGDAARIHVAENTHAHRQVLARAEKPLAFDPQTSANVTQAELEALLSGAHPVFITIGRFSNEKRHDKLLEAFRRFSAECPDAALVIIGGHGPLYEKTLAAAKAISPSGRIAVIRSLSNPMPVLKRCDAFVLSSDYEGLGIVLLEADSLGVPLFSTDIPGPHEFLTAHGGRLVENSVEGVLSGMRAFVRGEIKPLNIDFDAYNRRAVAQFEAILSQGKRGDHA